jgi:Secretion system C-terminal sorting domain
LNPVLEILHSKPTKMKKFYLQIARIAVCLFSTLLLIGNLLVAQCISPSLEFRNPVLISGTAGQVGAIYRFPNVIPAVDAHIRIDSMIGGASLVNIDVTGFGYDHAWQPRINGPSAPVNNKSYIRWDVSFKATGTDNQITLPCMSLSAVDIDGDNAGIKEFIDAFGVSSFVNLLPSSLTISQDGSNITALGSVANKTDIDTLAHETRITFNFVGISNISLRTGAIINNWASNLSTQRYNCLYFKNLEVASTLPVRFLSFSARSVKNNSVLLNWVTEQEVNNKQFEVQRSLDGREFSTVGILLSIDGNSYKAYQFTDKLPSNVRGKVYYRIRQIDLDNKFSLSKIIPVTLSAEGSLYVKMSPNPVVNDLTITLENNTSAARFVRIADLTGREIFRKNVGGLSTRQLQFSAQITNMTVPGLYFVEVIFDDGTKVSQKIIKR